MPSRGSVWWVIHSERLSVLQVINLLWGLTLSSFTSTNKRARWIDTNPRYFQLYKKSLLITCLEFKRSIVLSDPDHVLSYPNPPGPPLDPPHPEVAVGYRVMATWGRQGQQQQHGPVLILRVLVLERRRKASSPPASSIIRTRNLNTTIAK